ncbi:hypothetical protein ABKV19_024637 [Rosa sericea]
MVKNKGFLPSGPSEVSIQRQQIKEIIFPLLPACKEPDLDYKFPFKVDTIVANPPAYVFMPSHLTDRQLSREQEMKHLGFGMCFLPLNLRYIYQLRSGSKCYSKIDRS